MNTHGAIANSIVIGPLQQIKLAPARSTSSLRILALNWRCLRHPQAGGAEVNLFQQARYWVEDGHRVTVFTSDPGEEFSPGPIENLVGINILRQGGRFTVYLYAMLYVLFFSHRYDIILDVSNGIPFFAPLFSSKPVTLLVHHVHRDQWKVEFSNFAARLGWFLESKFVPWLYRNKQVITVSPTTEEELLHIGFKKSQISIVYNGLDVAFPMERTNSPTPRIAYIGRLKAYKRIPKLLYAIDKLRIEFPDIHLDIAGIGDTYGELERLADELGLKNHVTLHGPVDEETKARILSNATIFATPSMQEGWGISVLEANAYGCPAVAYNVPGLCASVPHNETGLLANTDEEFIENLARIIREPELQARFSSFAKKWAAMFDWHYCARSTIRVLTKAHNQARAALVTA